MNWDWYHSRNVYDKHELILQIERALPKINAPYNRKTFRVQSLIVIYFQPGLDDLLLVNLNVVPRNIIIIVVPLVNRWYICIFYYY